MERFYEKINDPNYNAATFFAVCRGKVQKRLCIRHVVYTSCCVYVMLPVSAVELTVIQTMNNLFFTTSWILLLL